MGEVGIVTLANDLDQALHLIGIDFPVDMAAILVNKTAGGNILCIKIGVILKQTCQKESRERRS